MQKVKNNAEMKLRKKSDAVITILIRNKRFHRILALSILFITAAAIGAVKLFIEDVFLPRCIFEAATGYHCVSCGATRATGYILSGNIIAAVYYNPLYVIFLTFCFLYLIFFVYRAFSPKPDFFKLEIKENQLFLTAFIVLGFWVIRNMPFYQYFLY